MPKFSGSPDKMVGAAGSDESARKPGSDAIRDALTGDIVHPVDWWKVAALPATPARIDVHARHKFWLLEDKHLPNVGDGSEPVHMFRNNGVPERRQPQGSTMGRTGPTVDLSDDRVFELLDELLMELGRSPTFREAQGRIKSGNERLLRLLNRWREKQRSMLEVRERIPDSVWGASERWVVHLFHGIERELRSKSEALERDAQLQIDGLREECQGLAEELDAARAELAESRRAEEQARNDRHQLEGELRALRAVLDRVAWHESNGASGTA